MENRRLVPQEELLRQREFMAQVRSLHGSAVRFALVDTYGCQQNEADSEQLRGMLAEMGYRMTADEKQADVILLNSCAVREHAEMRILGNVGALQPPQTREKGFGDRHLWLHGPGGAHGGQA